MKKRAEFTDRFMFNRVVCNEDVCRRLIRALIGLEVHEITYINAEQSWEPGPGERGVRMDVVARADGRLIDLEMQVARETEMGRRLRYYQAAMDAATLEPDAGVREVLKYVKEGAVSGALTEEIDRLVDAYNDDREWVRRVLTWEQDTRIQCRRAREEGIEIGIEQGIERGENRFGALAARLIAEGRSDEIVLAAEDREARERLFEELGL